MQLENTSLVIGINVTVKYKSGHKTKICQSEKYLYIKMNSKYSEL